MARRPANVTQADIARAIRAANRRARARSRFVSVTATQSSFASGNPQERKRRPLNNLGRSFCDQRHATSTTAAPASGSYPAWQRCVVCARWQGARIRLRAAFGSEEFDAEYQPPSPVSRNRRGPAKGWNACMVARALSGDDGMDNAIGRHAAPAREHLQACSGERRPTVFRQDHRTGHCGRQRAPGKHARPGAQLSRRNEWPISMGL